MLFLIIKKLYWLSLISDIQNNQSCQSFELVENKIGFSIYFLFKSFILSLRVCRRLRIWLMTAASCFLLFYLYLYRFSSIVAPFMQIYHATPPLAARSRICFCFCFCKFVCFSSLSLFRNSLALGNFVWQTTHGMPAGQLPSCKLHIGC